MGKMFAINVLTALSTFITPIPFCKWNWERLLLSELWVLRGVEMSLCCRLAYASCSVKHNVVCQMPSCPT